MPVPVFPEGMPPTIITRPNQRFATSALSTKYRKYAVNGEILKDNTSGEIFYKRKDDGKVISFFQNKKYMHDLTLEVKVLLNNNRGFKYPSESEQAFFLSTNYDLTAINKEEVVNIYTDDNVINNEETETLYTFRFYVSSVCNGFFFRAGTRDCDKPVIELITNYYNTMFKNYDGDVQEYLEQAARFNEEKWEDSNATLHYTVSCRYESTTKVYQCKDYIRLNESCMVPLPEQQMRVDFPSGISQILVSIDKIEYEKLHFMITHKDTIGGNFVPLLEKYIFQDARIEAHTVNVMHFIDYATDYLPLGNEILLAFVDLPYLMRYMKKMSALMDQGDVFFSVKRPLPIDWGANGMWAEMVRLIDTDGNITNSGSENSDKLDDLEDIFGPNRMRHGIFTQTESKLNDFFLGDPEDVAYGG